MDRSVKRMYRIKELLPSVYGISSSVVMAYLVVGKTGAMLIDTAYGFGGLDQAVREVTSLPVMTRRSSGSMWRRSP